MKRHNRKWIIGALRAALSHIEELEDEIDERDEQDVQEEFMTQAEDEPCTSPLCPVHGPENSQPESNKRYATVINNMQIVIGVPIQETSPMILIPIIRDFVEKLELPEEKILMNNCGFITNPQPQRDFTNLVNAINEARAKKTAEPSTPTDPSLN